VEKIYPAPLISERTEIIKMRVTDEEIVVVRHRISWTSNDG
jgi:hypothetical protein